MTPGWIRKAVARDEVSCFGLHTISHPSRTVGTELEKTKLSKQYKNGNTVSCQHTAFYCSMFPGPLVCPLAMENESIDYFLAGLKCLFIKIIF